MNLVIDIGRFQRPNQLQLFIFGATLAGFEELPTIFFSELHDVVKIATVVKVDSAGCTLFALVSAFFLTMKVKRFSNLLGFWQVAKETMLLS